MNLDVIVPRAAEVDRRHDGAKAKRAVGPSEDMATISETDVVVFASLISMPEVDHCSAKWVASPGQHKAKKFELTGCSAGLAQVATFW